MPNNSVQKWEIKEWFDKNLDWEKVYMIPRLCTGESRLRSFQYNLLHRAIFTNSRLVKAKIISGPIRCTFCNIDDETIEHLFGFCPVSRSLYLQLLSKILEHYDIGLSQVDLEPNNLIFGLTSDEPDIITVNHLLIMSKNFIYINRCNNNATPSFDSLLKFISSKINMEKMSLSEDNFRSKWQNFEFLF